MQDGQHNEPGVVIKPEGEQQASQPPISSAPVDEIQQPSALEQPNPDPQIPENQPSQPEPTEQTITNPEPSEEVDLAMPNADSTQVSWTASEFIANQKTAGWFGILAFGSVVLAAVVYILTNDITSTVVIAILGVIVGIFANYKPKSLQYTVDESGITIGEKQYTYDMFKSFSIGHEHAMSYVSLMPLKRFMPPISIHYAPEDEERITGTLANYLPYEEHKQDFVENLTKKFRF